MAMALAAHHVAIPCGTGQAKYEVVVGVGLLTAIAQDLQTNIAPKASTTVIVSDKNVGPLYAEPLRVQLEKLNRRVITKYLEPGEQSKCREVKAELEDWMLLNQRDSFIVAVGGGVIGDLAGYVAATYMRGIPFVQVPTSLLAMVDSSIGGKTGIDSPAGKNLIGAFHQPKRVYVDPSVLKTLPRRELVNGMAEIIKAGAIRSEDLYSLLETKVEEILGLEGAVLENVLVQAATIKTKVVTEDEREGGVRAILNFGHSIGHGLEALLQPEFLHGECVAIGMVKEAEVARMMGYTDSTTIGRLIRCIKAYGLPTRVPEHISVEKMLEKMAVDKKNSGGLKRMVLIKRIGEVASNPFTIPVNDDSIRLVMNRAIEVVPSGPISGKVRVPGSKSISNRALLMAGLAKGRCRITGLLHSDDTQVMMSSLAKLGARFTWDQDGQALIVEGTGGVFKPIEKGDELFLSNAGTAARFLTTTCVLASGSAGAPVVITGNSRMKERPIGPLVEALRSNGCHIKYLETEGCLPLAIENTGLKGGELFLEGKVSSQYVSSVLLNAPYAKEPLTLRLAEEHPTSLPYILMTIETMKSFGVHVKVLADNCFVVPTGGYINPKEYEVEVDASSATYPLAIAAVTGGEVTVEGLGSGSLQGDAAFFGLMRSMGCVANQTETSTTVKGSCNPFEPSAARLKAVDVDMETMTDAFMTAAVVAVLAEGTTRITGIANQRVKECNRIEAMVTELSKLGVRCGELEDGLWIEGVQDLRKLNEVLHGANIHCYNDHRIAMSFAVLGFAVRGVVITDKECTDKTYPQFWDDCKKYLGAKLQSVEFKCSQLAEEARGIKSSVILIGMRGAGKSSLGASAAEALGMLCIDVDAEIEAKLGSSIKEHVRRHGWDSFRLVEAETLSTVVKKHPHDAIIVCGGGITETQSCAELLKKWPSVLFVDRHIDDIIGYLEDEKERPDYLEGVRDVYTKRLPSFRSCSDLIFTINQGDKDFSRISADFNRFLEFVQNGIDISLLTGPNTFFLSLTFDDLQKAVQLLPEVSKGVDALELRVDLLRDTTEEFILGQIALIRRLTKLPIVYTVRSLNQGGAFPDDPERIFPLLHLGVKAGAEFVDMECCWDDEYRKDLIANRRHSSIISSFHAIQKRSTIADIKELFKVCYHEGAVQIVKVVTKAFEVQDCVNIYTVASEFRDKVPVIAVCTTDKGKLSRVMNPVLTPVTHEALPGVAAPGQLSAKEIMRLRKELGFISELKYYLLGHPISRSPSPAMHNAGFRSRLLPYNYSLLDSQDVEPMKKVLEDPLFGGASVTIPHKLAVIPLLARLTAAAEAIGAVNTIIPLEENGTRILLGDNTDWLGISRPLQPLLRRRKNAVGQEPFAGLVVGAGGTAMAAAYAVQNLGMTLYIYNRTHTKAQEVAARFGGVAVQSLDELAQVDLVVSTVPASANFVLPEHLLRKHPILFEAAYIPSVTAMLRQGTDAGCPCVQGYQMLIAQGIEQFQRWTRCPAPYQIMADAVASTVPEKLKPL